MMMSYDVIMRTIVELPATQIRALKALCKRERISRAEAVRRAVAKMLSDENPREDDLDAAFGVWRDKPRGGRHYVEKLRGEW
jgi:metal-responsive CopG/Arc/MetJ family transcriptional regulator